MTGRSGPDPAGTFLAARAIAGAMLGGVVIFALVTWLFLEDSFGHVTVLRHLIVGWALLEAVALFGIVVYGLTGRTAALVASVVVMGFGVARSWPDESWFPAEQVG